MTPERDFPMRWIDRQRQRSEQNAIGELIVFFVVLMILLGLWMLSVKP